MRELRRNMRLIGTLVAVAFICLSAWFAMTVFEQGSIWASDSHNTRLHATRTRRGSISDRDGFTLAATVNGQRTYFDDAFVRRSLSGIDSVILNKSRILFMEA